LIYSCCNENRKAAILGNPAFDGVLNGINYLEVLDSEAPDPTYRQRTLLVYCLWNAPASLTPSNVMIVGGESITNVGVVWVAPASPVPPQATPLEVPFFTALPNAAQVLVVRTTVAGDFSPYTLRLVNNAGQASEDSFHVTEVLAGFDPQLAEVQFSFKVECGPNFDCQPAPPYCPPEAHTPPPINYLAKDYGSFRGIMLDRLNQLLPNWGAQSEADIGVMMAELVSYVGDYMSYQQDAVATEAYIETARSRISLRRHARLVDYHVHDGCNARAWIALQAVEPVFVDRSTTRFYTYAPGMPSTLTVGSGNEEAALIAGVIVFEPMQDANLFPEQNQMSFYAWGDTDCCLGLGATEATLSGTLSSLQPGDVLIFQEVIGPQTGNPADADLRHRCAVRLTAVATQDGQGNTLVDPLFGEAPVTEIQWSQDDALPFAVCISSTYIDQNDDKQTLTGVTIVLGNVVLADQGLSFTNIPLGTVPDPTLFVPPNSAADRCNPTSPQPLPVRYRPTIPDGPITQAVPLVLAGSPVTTGIVMLNPTGLVSLTDSQGDISLMVGANQPFQWPQFFGVAVKANALHAGNFDLFVQYLPDGPATASPVTLESYTNLSLHPLDPNYAATQINNFSKLIEVGTLPDSPLGFPSPPTMLPNSGTVDLFDTSTHPYLVVEPLPPMSWVQQFGVLAQGNQQDQDNFDDQFNLLVVYNPPSGGVGVSLPVLVESFNNVSLASVESQFTSISQLITVKSFSDQPNASLSAFDLMNFNPQDAVPAISLQGSFDGQTKTWNALQDLLESGPEDAEFVVEVEYTGTATLRFGDGINGLAPASETVFTANYRVGNGTAGNVGAASLVFLATADARIAACTNPLPATGGKDMETADQIRRRAPQAFLTQERAINMTDYENVAEQNPLVEDAFATLRWTGSWYSVFIAAEPLTGGNLTPALKKALSKSENQYRLAGQDIQLESPQYVSLDIALTVCVDPDYFRSDVFKALQQVLGCGLLPNGQKAMFYPGNFVLGQTVYLSPIYTAVRTVAGVTSVQATKFQPQGVNTTAYLTAGELPLGAFQVARMENDPSFPNHGQLTLNLMGGK
jgi:hypothetical protein